MSALAYPNIYEPIDYAARKYYNTYTDKYRGEAKKIWDSFNTTHPSEPVMFDDLESSHQRWVVWLYIRTIIDTRATPFYNKVEQDILYWCNPLDSET